MTNQNFESNPEPIAKMLRDQIFGHRYDEFKVALESYKSKLPHVIDDLVVLVLSNMNWKKEFDLSTKTQAYTLQTNEHDIKISAIDTDIYSLLVTTHKNDLVIFDEDCIVAEGMFKYLEYRFSSE